MKKRIFLGFLSFILISCQIFSSAANPSAENNNSANQTKSNPAKTENADSASALPASPGVVPLNVSEPPVPFAKTQLKEWTETVYRTQGDTLPVKLEGTRNPPVVAELTQEQRNFLAAQGFVVIHSSEEQFGDIRDQVSLIYGQPYYLTTDAAYHALHLTFDAMLKLLEKDVLQQEAIEVTQTVLDQVASSRSTLKGEG